MRINIVSGPFAPLPPAPTIAAVEIIWQALATEFSKRGHQVTVLCRGHETQGTDEVLGGVRYLRRGRLQRTGWIYSDLLLDLLHCCRMYPLLREADVTLTFAFWIPVLLSLPRSKFGRLIVHVQRYPKGQMNLYRRADRLLTVSSA